MKRFTCMLLLLTLVLSITVSFCQVGVSRGLAISSNVISSDTTWRKIDSPIDLTGKIAVREGVTLTIEAGVTVNLHSYSIIVNGTLNAKGTDADKIIINGANGSPPAAPFSSLAIAYTYGILFNDNNPAAGSTLQNVAFNGVSLALGQSDTMNGCTSGSFLTFAGEIVNSNLTGLVATSGGRISNCNISGGIHAKWSSPIITNNTISGDTGVFCDETTNAQIYGNTINGCETGISVYGFATIKNNEITHNSQGITFGMQGVVIEDNLIAYNQVGIEQHSVANVTITSNNLQNNKYNYYMDQYTTDNISIPGNWWGTTDESAIKNSIYDSKNDYSLGTVNFTQYLTSPNSEATQTPTTQPAMILSQTPTAPEFTVTLIIILLAATTLLTLVIKKRQNAPFSFRR